MTIVSTTAQRYPEVAHRLIEEVVETTKDQVVTADELEVNEHTLREKTGAVPQSERDENEAGEGGQLELDDRDEQLDRASHDLVGLVESDRNQAPDQKGCSPGQAGDCDGLGHSQSQVDGGTKKNQSKEQIEEGNTLQGRVRLLGAQVDKK